MNDNHKAAGCVPLELGSSSCDAVTYPDCHPVTYLVKWHGTLEVVAPDHIPSRGAVT